MKYLRFLPAVFFIILGLAGCYLLSLAFAPFMSGTDIFLAPAKNEVSQRLNQPAGDSNMLYIERLGLKLPIVEGVDSSILLKGVWHRRPENGNPERGGNFVLSAHRFNMGLTPAGTVKQSPFYHLDKLAANDRIAVDYNGERYYYKVERKYTVPADATSIEGPSNEAKMTLYSCTLRGSADGREVVEALPVAE
ncbi:MAG TPA: class E sortase [Candidatus Saccharibacteria bacterium]|nr:class E sortase [Candidatus Saccharibacteria bacterium]HRK93945.1 class E sortase [Candidatus Saccharibacteria bacterium]